MKTLKTYLICAMFALCSTSCIWEFKLGNMPTEPVLFLESNVQSGGGDIYLYVQLANALAGEPQAFDPELVQAKLWFDGESLEVIERYYDDRMSKLVITFSCPELSAGDRVDAEVTYPGVKTAKSSTVVPAPVKASTSSRKIGSGDDAGVVLTVQIEDNPSEKNFYAISVIRVRRQYEKGKGYVDQESQDFFTEYDPTGIFGMGADNLMRDENSSYFVFDDSMARDGVCTIELEGNYTQGYEFCDAAGTILAAEWYYANVWVYNLSPEYYYYYTARYNVNNDLLGSFGFSPANFSYTNIDGGVGYFAARNRCEYIREEIWDLPPASF